MKKYGVVHCLLIGLLCVCGMAWRAEAQMVRAGIGAGGYLPTGDAADVYNFTPGVHAAVVWRWGGEEGPVGLEAQAGYWSLQDGLDLENYSASIIPLTLGVRYFLLPDFHLDGGAGIYRYAFKYKEKLVNVDGTNNNLGLYAGGGFQSGPFDLKLRVHLPDTGESQQIFVGVEISYLFLSLL
jgi:hypothetical protein